MNADEARQILAGRPRDQWGYLWQIRDLRAAGLDYQTARAIVECPELIDFLLGGVSA